MSGSIRDLVVLQLARLRLVCEAMGIAPVDVQLTDLIEDERHRLIGEAHCDLIELLDGQRRARVARDAEPAPADPDRTARFRELAASRRSKSLRAKARLADVSAESSPQPSHVEPMKRDRANLADMTDGHPYCIPNPVKHKVG